jgi:hypothetical protein
MISCFLQLYLFPVPLLLLTGLPISRGQCNLSDYVMQSYSSASDWPPTVSSKSVGYLLSLDPMSSKQLWAGIFNRRKKREARSSPQGTSTDNVPPPQTAQDDGIVPPVPPQMSSAAQTTYKALPQNTPTMPMTHSDEVVPPVPAPDTSIVVPVTPHDTAVLSALSQSVPTTYHLHAGATFNVSARDQYNYNSYIVKRMFCVLDVYHCQWLDSRRPSRF